MTRPDDDPLDPSTADRLARLPRALRPERDLWPGIETRLRRRRRMARALPWVIGLGLAASLVVLVLHRRQVREETAVASESQVLVTTLTGMTGPRSATAKSLLHHLTILDAAIAETEVALKETPSDQALADFLRDLYRRRLALLAQAARYAAES